MPGRFRIPLPHLSFYPKIQISECFLWWISVN
uniref:Uncharacterized protein n=1 Tax=Rhizophora mucronata TaxID=61149 RepID=A0A2P2PFY1_RHIMU